MRRDSEEEGRGGKGGEGREGEGKGGERGGVVRGVKVKCFFLSIQNRTICT